MSELEELVARGKWLLSEIRRFEARYGLSSAEFIESWREGLIPEPEDPEVHGDFLAWEALIEELREVEERLTSAGGR